MWRSGSAGDLENRYFINICIGDISMHICKYCKQERKNDNSLRNHERLCKLNPERKYTPFQDLNLQRNKKRSNQWV